MNEDSTPQSSTESARSCSVWEREALEKLLLEALVEQRRARRWNLAFRAFLVAAIGLGLVLAFKPLAHDGLTASGKSHTAVVDVTGTIAEGGETDADTIIEGLREAAEAKGVKGIVLRMNTPGGSPVQSAYVYDEIRRIKKEHPALPVYAVVTDVCASGGYYIASATDRIFVNPASIVGSIGVIMNGFGFVGTLEKLGVERRVMTAGDHKAILDPFGPVDPVEKQHVQRLLNTVHQQFIAAVKAGRGDRLKDRPEIFSGLVWTGAEGIELGLVDAVGELHEVAETVIGAKEIVNYSHRETLLDRVVRQLGTSLEAALTKLSASSPRLY
ncbi:putative signal peptide peptidase SppA [Methylococcus capsulatus str. Bath]|jgi:protease-4|uniref:Putative signal peptide peptidase SppA n=1 Tax=Methylococcus capsulatus (strain ATCC 33009 / NCIMB 11132 / Bath) TaxID=243233 RepID=Q608L2_METCA|nr:signal peptide peptidase SppA [Methylococcus capsulatus]AAU92506.1 putative signal peptide peptidase SppA [Methylococcus capsulatus str. Bath]